MNVWKVIFATLVIFGAGLAVGLFYNRDSGDKPVVSRPVNPPASNPWQMRNRDLLRRMDRELALSPEQHDRIEKIMATSQDRTSNLWKPISEEMGKETQHVCEEIREQLTPEQRAKFDTISRPHPERGGERGRRRGPGPFPPSSSSNHVFTNLPE